jgi:hypothetical protein
MWAVKFTRRLQAFIIRRCLQRRPFREPKIKYKTSDTPKHDMSQINEQAPKGGRNPLAWIAIIVVGLILFVFLGGDRRDVGEPLEVEDNRVVSETDSMEQSEPVEQADSMGQADSAGQAISMEAAGSIEDGSAPEGEMEGIIERTLLLPPGMRAREYIGQLRAAGRPYPLEQAYAKAQDFQHEGSLADAHLLYFFAAREDHLPAMLMMAQLSDPVLFQAENSLLDRADAIQAFKWYSKAAELGQPAAAEGIDKLRQWAQDAAAAGDPEARQLLLNIQ